MTLLWKKEQNIRLFHNGYDFKTSLWVCLFSMEILEKGLKSNITTKAKNSSIFWELTSWSEGSFPFHAKATSTSQTYKVAANKCANINHQHVPAQPYRSLILLLVKCEECYLIQGAILRSTRSLNAASYALITWHKIYYPCQTHIILFIIFFEDNVVIK